MFSSPERRVLFGHVLRNALLPVVTMLGMDIGIALGGAIFTETVYQLPGLGRTAIIAISDNDLALVQAGRLARAIHDQCGGRGVERERD